MIPGIKEFIAEFTSEKAAGDEGTPALRLRLILLPKDKRKQVAADANTAVSRRWPRNRDPLPHPGLKQQFSARDGVLHTDHRAMSFYLFLTLLLLSSGCYYLGRRRASRSPVIMSATCIPCPATMAPTPPCGAACRHCWCSPPRLPCSRASFSNW